MLKECMKQRRTRHRVLHSVQINGGLAARVERIKWEYSVLDTDREKIKQEEKKIERGLR